MKSHILNSIAIIIFIVACQPTTSQVYHTPTAQQILKVKGAMISWEAIASPVNAITSFCPSDMVEVEGEYCPEVDQVCTKLDMSIHNANGFVKCDEYRPSTKCLSTKTTHLHFCMDTYEFPNHKGSMPLVMVSWDQMNEACGVLGKRLCKDIEWTQACEGPERLPYPYGFNRDANACNIDHDQRPGYDASKDVLTPEMVAHLDQRVPSGSMERCVSAYGVHDMTGNVDESVVNSSGKPYKSAEMGGHWVRGARNRCRPRTIIHNESFQFYEIGGRCCKDINE